MNAQSQIATYLEVDASKISRCEEWAKVWFVVIQGKGARFVSKKVVKMTQEEKIIKAVATVKATWGKSHLDVLADAVDIEVHLLAGKLLELEFQGKVRQVSSSAYAVA